MGGGGGPPAASDTGEGAGRRGVRPCSHPSVRRSASRQPRAKGPGGGRGGRSRGRLATGQGPRPPPDSGRAAHQTSVSRGRMACTSAATSRQVAEGSGSGGGQVGSLSHTRPNQSTATAWGLPAAVSPSKRVRRRRGWRWKRSGGVPTLHPAVPGRPPHRRAGLQLTQRRELPAPRVGEAGAPVVWPGRAREEEPGVPPLQHLAEGGPLGPELGAIGALHGGQPDKAVHALVVGVPPPIPRPGVEVPEARDPRAQPLERGEGIGGAAPPSAMVGGGEHPGSLAVPPSQDGDARVPPAPGECKGAGRNAGALAHGPAQVVPVPRAKKGGGRPQGG